MFRTPLAFAQRALYKISCLVIKFYQIAIRPYLTVSCRFTPGCSEYALLALAKYGFFKGSLIALKRILRCHPFHSGGVDLP